MQIRTSFVLSAGLLLLVIMLVPATARAHARAVEVWLRAFIPDPGNAGQGAGYITPAPNHPGSMIRFLGMCFATDDRGFGTAPKSSARLETRFTIQLGEDGAAKVLPDVGRTTAGVTSRLNCDTGDTLEQKPGSVDRDHLGAPMSAGGVVQVIGQVQGRNMLTPAGSASPSIDYSFDIVWDPTASTVAATVNFGSFPAMEMYARAPGGVWVPVVQQLPVGTPWALGGDSFGINMERRTGKATIPVIAGTWEVAAPGRRFTVEFSGVKARWSERNASGAVLTREVLPSELPDGSLQLERANDAEVLAFLDFRPAFQAEILARGPKPSFLVLSWDGSELRGSWHGLSVTTDARGHFKTLVQPDTQSSTLYKFTRVK